MTKPITKLELRGVGPFVDATIHFPAGSDPNRADVHLLVGENGTGKSTAMWALAAAHDYSALPGLMARQHDRRRPAVKVHRGDECITPRPLNRSSFPAGFSYHALRYVDVGLTADDVGGFSSQECWTADGVHTGVEALPGWMLDIASRGAIAHRQGDTKQAEHFDHTLNFVEGALSQILGSEVKIMVDLGKIRRPLIEFRGRRLPLNVLPDGVRSILAWFADLCMRLELHPWPDHKPLASRAFAVFLDEVEVHLHPRWQRKILHVMQDLFPNAQLFVATHSPYIIASVSDAWIHVLRLDENGNATADEPIPAATGRNVTNILGDILDIQSEYSIEVDTEYARFRELRAQRLAGDLAVEEQLDEVAAGLLERGHEIAELVAIGLRSMRRKLKASA